MKFISGLFLCFICMTCTAQPASVLHKPYPVQYPFLDSILKTLDPNIISDADAIKKADEVINWAKNNNDNALADELTLLKFIYFIREKADRQVGQELVNLLILAKERKNIYLEANVLNILGDYWGDKKNHGVAFEYYLAAYNIYSKFTSEEFPAKKADLFYFGNIYMQYGDYDNAIKLLNEAEQAKGLDSGFTYSINNSKGMYYRKIGKYDSAELYFRKIYNDATKNNVRQWIGISVGNIGICDYYRGKYDQAIPLLDTDIETSLASHQVQNAVNSMYILANIYFTRHDNAKAEQLLERALTTAESKPFWPKYPLAESIYELLSKVNAAKNNMAQAYLYADSALLAKDSVTAQFNALSLAKAQEKMELVQRQADAKQIDNERRVQMLMRNSLIIGILLSGVIGILFINRQRLRQKKLEAEKKIAESELAMAAKSLDHFKQSVLEKNTIIQQFTNEIDQMKQGALQEVDNETLIQLQQSTILTDEQWEDFRILFEKVHKGFFNRLRDKMPDLTPGEIRFVALSKLKLSPKEMSSVLGISSSTIRNYRLRLRRKLGLDEDGSIQEIADAI